VCWPIHHVRVAPQTCHLYMCECENLVTCMYVYMWSYIFMRVNRVMNPACKYCPTNLSFKFVRISKFIYIYTCVYICIHVLATKLCDEPIQRFCVALRTLHRSMHVYINLVTYMYVNMYICMCMCICIYPFLDYMYICIYIYIQM